MNPAPRVVAVAVAAAAVAAIPFPIYLSVRAGDSQIFEPQPFDFALVAFSTFAIAAGAQVVPWRAATNVGILGVLVGAGLLFGTLATLSTGLVILPVALVLLDRPRAATWSDVRSPSRDRPRSAGPSSDTALSSCSSV